MGRGGGGLGVKLTPTPRYVALSISQVFIKKLSSTLIFRVGKDTERLSHLKRQYFVLKEIFSIIFEVFVNRFS